MEGAWSGIGWRKEYLGRKADVPKSTIIGVGSKLETADGDCLVTKDIRAAQESRSRMYAIVLMDATPSSSPIMIRTLGVGLEG